MLYAAVLAGCGDGLVNSAYRGEPILRLEGALISIGPGAPNTGDAEILVSVFWNRSINTTPPDFIEQTSVSTAIRFPQGFELRVFEPPLDEHFLVDDTRVAVGMLLLYADMDGNGSFTQGRDIVMGGNGQSGLAYATEAIPKASSPTGTDLPIGFSLLKLPLGYCLKEPAQPHHGGGRQRPVQRCTTDSSCPESFMCDLEFEICVPAGRIELVIDPDFELDRMICE